MRTARETASTSSIGITIEKNSCLRKAGIQKAEGNKYLPP